jgi:hypothetical protein
MFSLRKSLIVGCTVVFHLCASPVQGQLASPELTDFLTRHIGFSESDVHDVEKGKVETKALATNVKAEVAIFGIVLIRAPAGFFVQQFRNIEEFKKSDKVLQIGRFGIPPSVADLRNLHLDSQDLKDIRKCEVGKCKVKLPAQVIERFQNEIDWSAPGYYTHAKTLVQEMLVDYVKSYLEGGNEALTTYNDQEIPVSVEQQSRELRQESPYLFEYVPEFHEYLEQYPRVQLSGVEDFIYWSQEDFGLKPTTTLTHVSIYERVPQSRPRIIMATKQIYASHYFEGSLGLTALSEVVNQPVESFFLLYLNRSRANQLDGTFSGVRRYIVERRSKSAMKDNMKRIKAQVEVDYRTSLKSQQTP